jgi:serine/threonine-protein kinase
MLTGKVPFDAENPVAVAVMHMNDKPTPPSQLVTGVPPGLEQIVMKAVEKYQINRFKSSDDVYEALDNVNFVTGIIENSEVAEKLRQSAQEVPAEGDAEETADRANADGAEKKKKMKTGKDKRKAPAERHIKLRALAVLLALVCAIPVSYFIYTGIQLLKAPAEIELPSVLGMTEEEAKKRLADLKLELVVDDRMYSSEYEEGLIASQDRPEGSAVKEGFKLNVNLSRGPEPNAAADATPDREQPDADAEPGVPNVGGISLSEAVYLLESFGYKQGAVSREYSSLPVDRVVRQTPAAGEPGTPGMKVDLVLSDGPETIKNVLAPNLIGLSEDAAKALLEEAGLALGEITREANASYAEGLVVKQQYTEGAEVVAGAKVDVAISAGPPSDEPRSIVINIDFSAAPSEVFNLSVILSDAAGHTTNIVNEEVRYKSAGSEIVSVTGQGTGTVYVMFSGAQAMVYTIDFTTGTVSLR